jgi:hypothetical protein
MGIEWTVTDEIHALRAGWYIGFGCAGSRVRAAANAGGPFKTDAAAVAYVAGRALQGDPLAVHAFKFLAQDNEVENSLRVGVPPAGPAGGYSPAAIGAASVNL